MSDSPPHYFVCLLRSVLQILCSENVEEAEVVVPTELHYHRAQRCFVSNVGYCVHRAECTVWQEQWRHQRIREIEPNRHW